MKVSFRELAQIEAERYGSDAWVFLRELLQNARDAGARRVELEVEQSDGVDRLICRDDGAGMSEAHARRYLFALYASSKEQDSEQAGQFGVGFWSVLRFGPRTVEIRSRPRDGPAWRVRLEDDLQRVDVGGAHLPVDLPRGTEVRLERPTIEPGLLTLVRNKAQFHARFLTQRRSRPGQGRWEPLTVTVNGQRSNAELTLPAPAARFERRTFRGVVALGAKPRVELFAKGLFVRRASYLEDLLEPGDEAPATAPWRKAGAASLLPAGSALAPQVILDSAELEVLLARGDVRENRHLVRLVKTAEKELGRLIERQLQAARPRPWWDRLVDLLRRLEGRRVGRASLSVGIAAAALTALVLLEPRLTDQLAGSTLSAATVGRLHFLRPETVAYVDLGTVYAGPRLDPLTSRDERLELRYRPSSHELYLRALIVEDPGAWLEGTHRPPRPTSAYPGVRCASDCVDISLLLDGSGQPLRLPVPTGFRLDPSAIDFAGEAIEVRTGELGEAIVVAPRSRGQINYRVGPAPASLRPTTRSRPTPASLLAVADQLRPLPLAEKVRHAHHFVAEQVRYDRSPEAARDYARRWDEGGDFVAAALGVGKGDCDVQNGVFAALLRAAGAEARLAIGYLGRGGVAEPGLHAWVEVLDAGRWRVADASVDTSPRDGDSDPQSATLPRTAPSAFPSPSARRERPPLTIAASSPAGTAPAVAGSWRNAAVAFTTALSAILATAAVWRLRSSRARFVLRHDARVAEILGGALEHPELARLPALAHGRFIPLVRSPRAISLREAQRRLASGRLFCSSYGSGLAIRAAEGGCTVIDAGSAEGRVVSQGLGAVDLDEWAQLLDRSASCRLVRHLNRYLHQVGEPWRVGIASPLQPSVKVLDLEALGLGRNLVLIDPRHHPFGTVQDQLDSRSDEAAFRLLDEVAEQLDLAAGERARLLSGLALRAVVGEHGNGERGNGKRGIAERGP